MLKSNESYQIFDGSPKEWNHLVSKSIDASLLQTWEYGEAKIRTGPWSVERGLLLGEGHTGKAVQTLVRLAPIGKAGLAWINRGPVGWDIARGTDLNPLAERFCNQRGLYLRIAPSLSIENSEVLVGVRNQFRITETPGWASSVIDLTQSKMELRNALHGKWRNALTQAERAGLEIQIGTSQDDFDAFIRGYAMHLHERGSNGGLDVIFLSALQDLLPQERKIISVTVRKDGTDLAGAAIVRYGETGEYLAGHTTKMGRKLNAGQSALWTALVSLKDAGIKRFDLGGMDDRRTPPGIFRFKQRMGGSAYRLLNEIDACSPGLLNKLIRWRVSRLQCSAVNRG